MTMSDWWLVGIAMFILALECRLARPHEPVQFSPEDIRHAEDLNSAIAQAIERRHLWRLQAFLGFMGFETTAQCADAGQILKSLRVLARKAEDCPLFRKEYIASAIACGLITK